MTIRSWFALLLLTSAIVLLGMVLFVHATRARERAMPLRCFPLAVVHQMLTEAGETVIAVGAVPENQAFRLYVSPDKRTWTALRILPGGGACAIAAGNDFDMARPTPTGKPL